MMPSVQVTAGTAISAALAMRVLRLFGESAMTVSLWSGTVPADGPASRPSTNAGRSELPLSSCSTTTICRFHGTLAHCPLSQSAAFNKGYWRFKSHTGVL